MSDLALPCWKAADAEKILRIEALSGDKALFLATHTSVQGFEVLGTRGVQITEASEKGLLSALSEPSRQHAFCVIEGEPGSGKSHLIRWLDLKWPHKEDVRLLIQRADGSLAGTLRQLRDSLGEFQSLFDALGTPQTASLRGRAADFASRLGNMLRPDYLEKPLPDAQWCQQHGLGPLIRNTYVQEHWKAPLRILALLEGGADRKSQEASFHLGDILDLANQTQDVHDSGAAEALGRKLRAEAQILKRLQDENCPYEDMGEAAGDDLRWSPKVLDALNRRKNDALRSVLGVTPEGLKRLFDDLRRALHQRGQRLVLLLEDITSWQGVDDSLVDVLVTDAATRSDVCPLISVVGVTPHYYQKDLEQGNYRDRITHHIKLGSGRSSYAAALRTRSDRLTFAARYLSASRAGSEALEAWGRDTPDSPPPNPCTRCKRRQPCHDAFGAHDDIGLFPFNATALETLFDNLSDSGNQNHRTPRGFLQSVLGRTLLSPHVLEDGDYPGVQVEPGELERRYLTGVLRTTVERKVARPEDQERLRRLYAYWGNARPVTITDNDGALTFGGVKRSISDAFDLPWLGGDTAEASETVVSEPRADERELEDATDPRSSTIGEDLISAEPQEPTRAAVAKVAAKKAPPKLSKSSRDKLRESIANFRESGDLENIHVWNKALYQAVTELDPRKLGIDRHSFAKIFTPESVKLADTGQQRLIHFIVPREDWIIDGLESLVFLTSTAELEFVEKLDYRQKLANFLRRLEKLARVHVNRRLSLSADGAENWDPVAAAVQVLLARAWLRGDVAATASPADQWIAILSNPGPIETDPSARVAAWRELLDGTNRKHSQIRLALREMVSSPQGEASSWGIADVSTAAQALIDLQRLKFAPTLDEARSLDQASLEPIREAQLQLADKLPGLAHREREVMSGRSKKLAEALRGNSVERHGERLQKDIAGVANDMPVADPQGVTNWLAAFQKNKDVFSGDRAVKIEELIVDLEEPPRTPPAADLSWLAQAPAKDLDTCWTIARDAELLIERLVGHLEDLMHQTRDAPDLARLRQHGEALETTARAARQRLSMDRP
jgi:hypothetical protein